MAGIRFPSWLGVAALVVGVLWISHGAFDMLQPLGRVTEYQDDLGYSTITDTRGFRLYGLPGPPAALLSAALILAMARRGRPGWRRTVAAWLARVAALLATAAVVGVAVLLDPPFEAGMNLGRLLISVAAILVGDALRRDGGTHRLGPLLVITGGTGVLVLVARIMVNALEFLPGAVAFGVSVAFGLAWGIVGLHILGAVGAHPAVART